LGTKCPVCQTHQPFVKHLTKNQESAKKAVDVIGHKLGCGHTVGGEKFMRFQKEISEIEHNKAKSIMQLESDAADQIASCWAKINATSGKGGSS